MEQKSTRVAVEHPGAIVIGASAGGLHAVQVVMREITDAFPRPIIVVMHVMRGADATRIDVLADSCRIPVVEALDKMPIQPGHLYLAPPGYHTLVEYDHRFTLSASERVQYSIPSIDVLFESAADVYRNRLIGVLLTGANEDGANGLARIQEKGGQVVVQDPEEAEFSVMPSAGRNRVSTAKVWPLEDIGRWLKDLPE